MTLFGHAQVLPSLGIVVAIHAYVGRSMRVSEPNYNK
jgi:hypothetical protein